MITEKDIYNIGISNVIILDTDESGDLYMEKLFPLWVDVIVVTLEGKYPINPILKARVFKEIENNPDIFCILFGAESEKLKIKTQKKLNMAQFLCKDLIYFNVNVPEFNFTDEMIVSLIMAFTGNSLSRIKIDRVQKYNNLLDYALARSVKWYHYLIKSKSD
jgi:hypothetical protein